jgi:hypothetical protein
MVSRVGERYENDGGVEDKERGDNGWKRDDVNK